MTRGREPNEHIRFLGIFDSALRVLHQKITPSPCLYISSTRQKKTRLMSEKIMTDRLTTILLGPLPLMSRRVCTVCTVCMAARPFPASSGGRVLPPPAMSLIAGLDRNRPSRPLPLHARDAIGERGGGINRRKQPPVPVLVFGYHPSWGNYLFRLAKDEVVRFLICGVFPSHAWHVGLDSRGLRY